MKQYPFTKTELQNAVAIVRNATLAALPADDEVVAFSDAFETQMYRRITHADRRVRRRKRLVNIAAVFVAAIILVSTFFAVDVEARDRFFDWIKAVYENQIVYRFFRTENTDVLDRVTVEWVPKGYILEKTDSIEGRIAYVYHNSQDQKEMIISVYAFDRDTVIANSPFGEAEVECFTIDGMAAQYIDDEEPFNDELTVINDAKGVVIDINGIVTKEEMIQIVRSIQYKQ